MDAYTMELMAGEQRRDRLTEAAARRLLRTGRATESSADDPGWPTGRPARGLGLLAALRRLVRLDRLAPTA
jgi:hypothetical protein